MSMSQQTASIFSKTGEALVLESVNVLATVNGILLDVVLEQHFINPTDHALEITYTFPLPWQATLLDVEAVINQQKMVGSVYEKKQAEKKYEQAMSEGNSAMLLESLDNGLWSLNLGNLASKESCKINVHYVQLLRVEHGHVRVTIPTVIAPRYGKHDNHIAIWQQPQTDILAAYPFQINCVVQGELANSLIASPSHEIQTRFSPQGVAISLRSKAWLDRDFVLELKELAQHSWGLMTNNSQQEQIVLLGLVPQVSHKQHRHIKILVDCSGSMGGDRIEAAKRSLTTFINYLQPTDAFSLSRFGSYTDHLWHYLQLANIYVKNFAKYCVREIQADMGEAEIEKALFSTFNLDNRQEADVLLITDGDINDINPTVNMAKKFQQRIFVVGIGSSAAEPLLRQLAEETGGACEFVNDNEPVEEAINRTLVRLGQAQLKNIRMSWPKEVQVLWQSPLPKSVFYGDTLAIYARVKGLTTNHSISLLGVDGLENQTLFAQIKAQVIDENMIPVFERMAASSEITNLLADSYQAQALALSLKHCLVNQLTSYCLLLERAEQDKLLDLSEQVNVKQMLVAGWGGASLARKGKQLEKLPNRFYDYVEGYYQPSRSLSEKGKLNLNNPHFKMGLSPFDLANLLVKSWPDSYKKLKEIDLSQIVIDWLDKVARPILQLNEQHVIEVFLTLFIEQDVYDFLSETRYQCTDEFDKELKKLVKLHSTDKNVNRLWQVLDMTGHYWPICMFNLTWGNVEKVS